VLESADLMHQHNSNTLIQEEQKTQHIKKGRSTTKVHMYFTSLLSKPLGNEELE
jgi:hypothetical protein